MQLLVTGGAGYIGSVVAEQLLQARHQVIIIDNLSRGHRQAVPSGAELVVGDLADTEELTALFRRYRFDAVLHFAAFIEAGESMKFPERSSGTIPLMRWGCWRRCWRRASIDSSFRRLRLCTGIPRDLQFRKKMRCSPPTPTENRNCWWNEC